MFAYWSSFEPGWDWSSAAAVSFGVAAQPPCFQAESRWPGSRGSVTGFQQPIRGCGCVRPGRATSPGAGRLCVEGESDV